MSIKESNRQSGSRVTQVRLLGPIALLTDTGTAIDVPSVSQRRLLGVLALNSGRTVRSELLADLLDLSPGALRKTVSRVRALVGAESLHTDPVGYRLDLEVDAFRFARAVRESDNANDRVAALEAALNHWQGEALDEFRFELWAQGEATRLTELRNTAIENRVDALIAQGDVSLAIASIEAHIAQHPLRDRPRALLMRALAGAGRSTDALRAYQQYRSYLGAEVGTEPSRELRSIEQRIINGWDGSESPPVESHSSAAASVERPTSLACVTNLPVPGSPWIGATDLLKRTTEELTTNRIVTLTGPGGVGKTRSAIEIGRRSLTLFPDGVWIIELAAVSDPGEVASAVASTIGIAAQPGQSILSTIADWLVGRSALVILDNCEHVLGATAEAVTVITRQAPTVTILATSRERLAVRDEKVVVIDTLSPATAIEFFCDRATAADASLTFTEPDLDVIAEICHRLDGIPLAIELAAARTRSLDLADMLARVDDRFVLLRAPRNEGIDHHRTLLATVSWSYNLLTDHEKLLFERVSVFSGSFDLAAVESVCSDHQLDRREVVHLLSSLVDKSMIVVDRSGRGVRYRVLETLRSFADQCLSERGELTALALRHLGHFVDVAERAERLWFSTEQLEADATYEREWDNLRAAHSFACSSGELELVTRLLNAIIAYAYHAMRTEHGEWCSAAVAATPETQTAFATNYAWAGWWAMLNRDLPRALDFTDKILDHTNQIDDPGVAMCIAVKVFALWSLRQRIEAAELVIQLDRLLPNLGPWHEYVARRALFSFHNPDRREVEAARIAEISETIGSVSMIASGRYYQGIAEFYSAQGDPAKANAWYEEGVALARSAKADLCESQNLVGLQEVKFKTNAPDAFEACAAALKRLVDLRYWLWLWQVVDIGIFLLAKAGDVKTAATTLGYLERNVAPWQSEPRGSTKALLDEEPHAAPFLRRGASLTRETVVLDVIAAMTR